MAYKDKSQATRYNNEYNKQAYDRITIMLPKGSKARLKEYAIAHEISVNELIRRELASYLTDNE